MNKAHYFIILLLTSILFTTHSQSHTNTQQNYSSLKPNNNNNHSNFYNETIYKLSKQLCWHCLGEAVQFLYAHNLARAAKWDPPLAWDPALEHYARWWAGVRRGDCALRHSIPETGAEFGENIFWGGGDTWTPLDAVRVWTDEEKDYDYAGNAYAAGQQCGHYTQVVWRRTRWVGCARVVCEDGDVFVTCNYDPPGNYVGEKPY